MSLVTARARELEEVTVAAQRRAARDRLRTPVRLVWPVRLARLAHPPIGSSAYSFDTNTWSEPLTITSESQIDNHELRFNDAGAAVAYLDNSGTSFPYGELKSVLSDAGWSTPQVSSELEASGATYQVMGNDPLQVARVEPRTGEKPLPGLERPRCEGY